MTEFEFKMPRMGESITEAAIITWFKNVGDPIEIDENVPLGLAWNVSGSLIFISDDKIRNKNQYEQVCQLIEAFIKKATNGGGFHSLNKKETDELHQLTQMY